MWPFTWKNQRDKYVAALEELKFEKVALAKAYDTCNSLHAWIGTILNNALTLLYCVAIAIVIWKFKDHLNWRP